MPLDAGVAFEVQDDVPYEVLCANCDCLEENVDSGSLVCRFNTGLDVPAVVDQARRVVCCTVNKGLCKADVSYQLCTPDGRMLHTAKLTESTTDGEASQTFKKDDVVEEKSAGSIVKKLSFLDRYLVVWVLGAMILGVLLGYFVPGVAEAWSGLEIDSVSLPIAFGLWFMMYPVLCKVRYGLMGAILFQKKTRRLLYGSICLNWVVGPALMTGLAWATLPDLPEYREGVIMIGLARCIAMVLIWNVLAEGDNELCAIMVAVNSILQIVLYAPLAIFYLEVVSGGAGLDVSFWDIAKSVLIFLGIPLVAAIITRYTLLWLVGPERYESRFLRYIGPVALIALLYTIVVLFSSQATNIIENIGDVFRVAVPLLLYFAIMFFTAVWWSLFTKCPYPASATQAFTAASNNFELAIAVAVATFGVTSPQALSATVGPLIEVPVLLALVYVILWLRPKWWPQPVTADAKADATL